MKANEASEKIYMSPAGVLYKGDKQQSDDIEYVRTDAFIKKAEEFIYSAENKLWQRKQKKNGLNCLIQLTMMLK